MANKSLSLGTCIKAFARGCLNMKVSLLHLETLLDSIIRIGTQYLDTSGDGMPCEIIAVTEFNPKAMGVRFELTWKRPGVSVIQSVFCPSSRVDEDRRKIGDMGCNWRVVAGVEEAPWGNRRDYGRGGSRGYA